MTKTFSPYGELLVLHSDGELFQAETESGLLYVSQYKTGLVTAFEEGVSDDNEIFFSRHDNRNYKAQLSHKLTKSRDGKPVFIILLCVDYLV